jgi:magnesium chelatase family protein
MYSCTSASARNIQNQPFESKLPTSARLYHRILKLARTIADLAGCEEIHSAHLAEALQYRQKLIMN